MSIRVFDAVAVIWEVLFLLLLIFCIVNAILSVKKGKKRFYVSYILEIGMVLINLLLMYMVDGGYVLYGENKFSGLSRLGDWLEFALLFFITLIPIAVTVVCHMVYAWKRRKQKG